MDDRARRTRARRDRDDDLAMREFITRYTSPYRTPRRAHARAARAEVMPIKVETCPHPDVRAEQIPEGATCSVRAAISDRGTACALARVGEATRFHATTYRAAVHEGRWGVFAPGGDRRARAQPAVVWSGASARGVPIRAARALLSAPGAAGDLHGRKATIEAGKDATRRLGSRRGVCRRRARIHQRTSGPPTTADAARQRMET